MFLSPRSKVRRRTNPVVIETPPPGKGIHSLTARISKPGIKSRKQMVMFVSKTINRVRPHFLSLKGEKCKDLQINHQNQQYDLNNPPAHSWIKNTNLKKALCHPSKMSIIRATFWLPVHHLTQPCELRRKRLQDFPNGQYLAHRRTFHC